MRRALAPRSSSTTATRRSVGNAVIAQCHPQFVVALERARETEQLVLDVGEMALRARDFEEGVRVGVDPRALRHG